MKGAIPREESNIYLSMAVSLAAVQKATGDTGKSWLLFSTQLIKKGGDLQNIVKNGENGMEKKKKAAYLV